RMVLATYGASTGFCVDPIEKKPLNHFLPGTAVLSFGTAGCNLGCQFCQNWDMSKSREVRRGSEVAEPETIAEAAVQLGCDSVAFTYNDPVVWAEYAIDTARACRRRGIKTVAVTAGYIAPAARAAFFELMDAANVDLKAFSEDFYAHLAYGHLQPVLDTLAWLKSDTDVWFEITNLIIPGANDALDEIGRMCDWILEHVGDEVPLHFTAFHPDFRLRDRPATPIETLLAAHELARSRGIKYVYVGNVVDPVHDSTYCPSCSALVIERSCHELGAVALRGGCCHRCQAEIAGRFQQRVGSWGRRRLPVRIAAYAPSAARAATPEPARGNAMEESKGAVPVTNRVDAVPPLLSEEQRSAVFRVACELVVAGIRNRPPALTDPTLSGAADLSIMGAFVTLKRRGHLRACCGTLGQPMKLLDALRNAAHRTATDDQRLPPISATELPHLQVDVSLLHGFRTLTQCGSDRAAEVVVGRHGLTIHRGQSGGLLLPSVPVEHGWDAESFLRHVCRKAGLPSTAWQDDAARLQTFEAVVLEGQIGREALGEEIRATVPRFTADELRRLAEHCQRNVVALCRGATPNYYVSGCGDATVQGVALTIESPSGDAMQYARLSMRPGVPLQATLYQLTELVAARVRAREWPGVAPDQLRASVAVLHDSALHGTVADPDLSGFDPSRRALVVTDRGRNAWVYDPAKSASALLDDAVRAALVLDPQVAGVFSLAADTSCRSFSVSNVPRAEPGPSARPPAVAGVFYPDRAEALREMTDGLLAGADDGGRDAWPAVMVPHAGLRF
ncbi:MAG: AmmeMemoRadiSam system radical SAM enzyme, partial [Planctomycetes bacterium]|nr:AmmeMemoRadiSam system radical SAM enzyme [Planctomycetota bacterium]